MYTIKEAAEIMNVSEHTLRFWAKNGFIPDIERDRNNIRLFSEHTLGWIKIVKCLRNVGVDLKSVKKYIDLCLIGDSTIQERYEIILETKKKALIQMEELKKQLEVLDYKENYYKALIANNMNDKFNPTNVREHSICAKKEEGSLCG